MVFTFTITVVRGGGADKKYGGAENNIGQAPFYRDFYLVFRNDLDVLP